MSARAATGSGCAPEPRIRQRKNSRTTRRETSRCRQQQQRARLLPRAREVRQNSGHGARTCGKLGPGAGLGAAPVLDEREGAAIRERVGVVLQTVCDRETAIAESYRASRLTPSLLIFPM
jgi:hypothetical protein